MTTFPTGIRVEPILTWPGVLAHRRFASPFDTGFTAMAKELEREIRAHKARDVVLLVAMHPGDFRKDGLPYASAKMQHPGVILTWTTPDGTFSFPSDAFEKWEDNLLAIVRTVEKLRAVARYKVTKHGEQYAAWKAIESGSSPAGSEFDTPLEAVEFLEDTADATAQTPLPVVVRRALRNAHPDLPGGSNELFARVNGAVTFLKEKGVLG